MCGIAAIWGASQPKTVETMMGRMVHRGPDAHGRHDMARGTLGHRRLSIMDPTGGDQPLFSEDGRIAVVGNGEIYNFRQLAAELTARHTFATTSDNEMIVHLFEEIGVETAARLDGMFAFVLSDGEHVYAARDTVGIKPLYYGKRDGYLLFASELKALVGVADDVAEFPPGHYYHSATGFQQFQTLPTPDPQPRSVAEMCQQIRLSLEAAVVKRLMSDVPLGAFLSGGLDSSIIAAIARRNMDSLHTFSVGFAGSPDLVAARLVADHIGSIHHEYLLDSAEIQRDLPQIIYHLESYDQDLVRSGMPTYYVSRLAAQHVKVILTGEGADELFAGYTYMKDVPTAQLAQELYRATTTLHNINLQRVDRLTMAQSIEGRVPFLDLDFMRVAQQIPAEWLIRGRSEKWILRKACEDLLPAEILWRGKAQFDEGSGSADKLKTLLNQFMSPTEAQQYFVSQPHLRLRSPEESVYHKLLAAACDNSPVMMENVARWADRPNDIGATTLTTEIATAIP